MTTDENAALPEEQGETGEETQDLPSGEELEAPPLESEEPEVDLENLDFDDLPDVFEEEVEEEDAEGADPTTPSPEAEGNNEGTEDPEEGQEENTATEKSRYSKLKLQLEQELQKVEEAKSQLAPQMQRLARWEKATADYEKDPVEFVKHTLAVIHGTDDEGEIDNHLHELFNDISSSFLGELAPDDYKQRKAERKQQSEYRKMREEIKRIEEQRKLEKQRATEAQYVAAASNHLVSNATEYPALQNYAEVLAEQGSTPAHEVVALIKMNVQNQLRKGVPPQQVKEMSFVDAAKTLENFVRSNTEKELERLEKIRAATQPDKKEMTEPGDNKVQVKKGKTRSRKSKKGTPPPKVKTHKGEDLDRLAVASLWTDD